MVRMLRCVGGKVWLSAIPLDDRFRLYDPLLFWPVRCVHVADVPDRAVPYKGRVKGGPIGWRRRRIP